MGQKVHPYGFRLGITTDHRSQWFSDSSKAGERYSDYVAEDVLLRRFLQEKLDRAGVSHMVIRRTRDRVTVDVHVARPAPERGGFVHRTKDQALCLQFFADFDQLLLSSCELSEPLALCICATIFSMAVNCLV